MANPFKLSKDSLKSLAQYVQSALAAQRKVNTEMYNRLASIDYNYFMYKKAEKNASGSGKDIVHGNAPAADIFKMDDFTVPLVISQVDTYVGYLAEVYLSGYPLFPVVSTDNNRVEAEKLESMIDSHAEVGGYARQLLKSFYNGMKYNFMPIVIDWDSLPHYDIATSITNPTQGNKIERAQYYYNKLLSCDAYNSIWDIRKAPADVAYKGEWGGYTELITRIELVNIIQKYNTEGTGYSPTSIYDSVLEPSGAGVTTYFQERPDVNDFMTLKQRQHGQIDWMAWAQGKENDRLKKVSMGGQYERTMLYARIVPSEHGITNVPQPNTPQIWRLDYIHPGNIIGAKRIITFLDMLPIMFGQPLEDDFEMQTYSIAERGTNFQEASSKLLNIRFAGARRAVSDRAVYDPNIIRSSDMNAPAPAAKIPFNVPVGSQRPINTFFQPIPYNDRSTEGVVQDAERVIQLSEFVNGGNKATQGQFVKGNKTRGEWEDVMGFSNNRLRLPALMIEHQIFVPMKSQIRLNILQYGPTGVFQNYRTGEPTRVTEQDLEAIRQKTHSFKLADGYTPSSKILPPDIIQSGLQTITQIPQLAEAYGASLPNLFANLMSVAGVQNLEQYSPNRQQQDPNAAPNDQGPSQPPVEGV